MAGTQVLLRRGTTAEHSTFTGAEGEVTVDTTKDTLVVHDGTTAGGRPLLREDLNNLAAGAITAAKLSDSFIIDLTTVTAVAGDYVAIADASDSNNKKKALVSDIVALATSFPSGTRMTFNQTSAPTGWTKDTTAGLNDSIMRIVTGTVGSGGSTAFSTFNGQTAVGATTLTTDQIPSHSHNARGTQSGSTGTSGSYHVGSSSGTTVANTGGGNSHDHSITTNIKYNDFIIASKD